MGVDIDKRGDETAFTFGAKTSVSELRAALDNVPQTQHVGFIGVTYYSHDDQCKGQSVPDEEHHVFVATLISAPPRQQWAPGKVA